MITPNKIKKSQALRIIKLLEQQTRAEIMARLPSIGTGDSTDYYSISIHEMDKLREFVFGTSDLVKLGYKWNLLKKKKRMKRK